MVKLTTSYLIKRITQQKQLQVRKKDETDRQFLNRITHLYLQGQYIDEIAVIKECSSVLVIYLQNNLLESIHNFSNFLNTTHLYLQRNKLKKIENLDDVVNLKKLYISHNEISVVEGLENLHELRELHIDGQNLPLGETLYFEPRTVQGLGQCLEVLDVSNNNLPTLNGLEGLYCLILLRACDNKLTDLDLLVQSLRTLPSLQQLHLNGNEVTRHRKYRDTVVYFCKHLVELDDKHIHENTRNFIQSLTEIKESRSKLTKSKSEQVVELEEEPPIPAFLSKTSLPSLPHNNSTPVLFPQWNLRTNVNPRGTKNYVPRTFFKLSPRAKFGKSFHDV